MLPSAIAPPTSVRTLTKARSRGGIRESVTPWSRAMTPSSRGRRFLLLGLGLSVLGVVAYVVELALHRLTLPWYIPVSALLGAVLIGASLRERRGVWRTLALGGVLLLAGIETLALYALRLPSYAGPIAVGRAFPA